MAKTYRYKAEEYDRYRFKYMAEEFSRDRLRQGLRNLAETDTDTGIHLGIGPTLPGTLQNNFLKIVLYVLKAPLMPCFYNEAYVADFQVMIIMHMGDITR